MDSCHADEGGAGVLLDETGDGAGFAAHLFAQISLTFLALLAAQVYRHLFCGRGSRQSPTLAVEVGNTSTRVFSRSSVTMPMPGMNGYEMLTAATADEDAGTSRARSEYRAILENEGYQDMCADEFDDDNVVTDGDGMLEMDNDYAKPPKVKYATSSHQWGASLESITEEEESGSDAATSPRERTYARYINNVNESPKIFHAGRVWCITKRLREEERDDDLREENDPRYLETDIDDVNDTAYERYEYRLANEGREGGGGGEHVLTPTPSYILQETAIPAAYPGHSQYLSKDFNDDAGQLDRPNFITTESGSAEWSYSFPIATDSYATALDRDRDVDSSSTVTYSNEDIRPSATLSRYKNIPLIETLDSGEAVDESATEAVFEQDDLNEDSECHVLSDQENAIEPAEPEMQSSAPETQDAIETKAPVNNASCWVETIPTAFIIPTPDLSPTIHRQDIPMETDIDDDDDDDRNRTMSLSMNPNFDQNSRHNSLEGLLETDIDDIPDVEEKVESSHQSKVPKEDKKVNDKVKGQSKGKKFMDKFRRAPSSSSGSKQKQKKGVKNKENVGTRSKFVEGIDNPGTNDDDEQMINAIEIDDDDDLRTINESEGPDTDDYEDYLANDLSPCGGHHEFKAPSDDKERPETPDELLNNRISVTSESSDQDKTKGVRLLCCHQAPRLDSNSDDAYSPALYLISADDDQFHGRLSQRRHSTSTIQTDIVFSSDEDDDGGDLSSHNHAKFINGIEMEPEGRHLQSDLETKGQADMTSVDLPDLEDEIKNIEIRSSVRLHAYTTPTDGETVEINDDLAGKMEAKSPDSDKNNKSDNNVSENELNCQENIGNIIVSKGFAGTNTHAFYLIGTPTRGDAAAHGSGNNDVTEPTHLRTDQESSSSNDMFVQNKQEIKTDLDRDNITSLSYTNIDKLPLLTQNPSALDHKNSADDKVDKTSVTTSENGDNITKLDTTQPEINEKSSNYNDDETGPSALRNLSANLTPQHLTDGEKQKGDRVQELLQEWKNDVTLDDKSREGSLADDKQIPGRISTKHSEPIVKQSSAKLTNVAFSSTVVHTTADGESVGDTNQPSVVETIKNDCLKIENNHENNGDDWDKKSTTSVASDASERASAVITEHRIRVRESLKKLNLPDWYKNSRHHKKSLNNEHKVDYPDYVSEPRFGRSWSRSSVASSDWSMDSAGTGSSYGAATKLSFLSAARYRRAYHNYDRYYQHRPSTQLPIRTAFSCAELPRRETSTRGDESDVGGTTLADPEAAEKSRSSDALLSINDTPAMISQSGSPLHASSPNLSPSRERSRSTGERPDNFSALSIRRLEHKASDAVFYITGKQSDSTESHSGGLPSPDDSGYNDSFESKSSRYEVKEAVIRPTVSVTTKQSSNHRDVVNNNEPSRVKNAHSTPVIRVAAAPSRVQNARHSTPVIRAAPMKPPRLVVSQHPQPQSSSEISTDSEEQSYQFKPITLAEDEVSQYFNEWPDEDEDQHRHPESLPSANQAETIYSTPTVPRPDPRYNPDGSRNDKVSPFPIVTQSGDELTSSEGSPAHHQRRKNCNVRITITDTSISDDIITAEEGDLCPSEPPPPPPVQPPPPPPRPKTPMILDEIRDSDFAAVLSVVTSSNSPDARHHQRAQKKKKEIPPPLEVTMEEIVDSLLGLSSSFSNADLSGGVESISSNPEQSPQQQQVITKTTSLDSLFSEEEMSPLNSIIIKGSGGDGDTVSTSSSIQSTPRSARDIVGDEVFMVKCSYRKCARVKELDEARETYKTCHNCYTYYCSRQCRAAHWERHKKKCLFSRTNSAAKHVIYNSRYNEELQDDLSRIARTGYLSRGRGAILLIFPDIDSAEGYMSDGIEALHYPPTYSTIKDLESSGLFADHLPFLIEMCRTYDPNVKFVLNVAIMTADESTPKPLPRKPALKSVRKCAKVRLSMMQTNNPRQLPGAERETLILTAPSGVSSEGILDKKSRQICFVHIQRQLRQRGVNLRHQHPEIYDQLCQWVEYHEHFTPVTIYPREGGTGPRFMCVIMPDSDPNDFGWTNNPQLLESIDLDAELEKLEHVVSNVAADQL